jgi:hypothetical protein
MKAITVMRNELASLLLRLDASGVAELLEHARRILARQR